MGAEVKCARCGKGINLRDKLIAIGDDLYHAKCAQRIEKGRK